MPDFTLKTYNFLLQSLLSSGYVFQPFCDFMEKPLERAVILRHDVDARPGNSLTTAQIEHKLGIRGTYYFRIIPRSNQPAVIRQIALLGHEIGYHYEDLALAGKTFKGQGTGDKPAYRRGRGQGRWGLGELTRPEVQKTRRPEDQKTRRPEDQKTRRPEDNEIILYELAIQSFSKNLAYFRQFGPVKTICMHGSPLSRFDNRKIWEKYDYRNYGITGEPYFDIDFSQVLYLTDTGRRWDGEKVSLRDKVLRTPVTHNPQPTTYNLQPTTYNLQPSFHSTPDIITAARNNLLPDQLMITIHPQRWTNNPILWTRELVWQNSKNAVKRVINANAAGRFSYGDDCTTA